MKEREEKERKYLFCIILLEGFEVIPYEISKFRLSQNFLDCSCMCLISIEVSVFNSFSSNSGCHRQTGSLVLPSKEKNFIKNEVQLNGAVFKKIGL